MRGRRDMSQPDCLWVDRGLDDRADHFSPCPNCRDAQFDAGMLGWQELNLCPQCGTRLEIEGAIEDAAGRRPLIWPDEQERETLYLAPGSWQLPW